MTDLQKASLTKRFSAFLLDIILVATLIVGVAALLSWALGFDAHVDALDAQTAKYEEKYGVKFNITEDEYNKLTEAEKEARKNGMEALNADKETQGILQMLFSLSLVILTFSILTSIALWEFVIPLIFKNGQTVGKKIFGLGLMRTDGVRVSTLSLFARAILGKYTIETMVPVLLLVMTFFGIVGMMGPIVILLLLIFQIILVVTTNTNSMIHDTFGVTVVVDLASQKIFDSVEEMIEYKKRIHAEKVAKKDY